MKQRRNRFFTFSDPGKPSPDTKMNEKIDTLQNYWKKQKQDKTWLQKVLSIYRFDLLGGNEFVMEVAQNKHPIFLIASKYIKPILIKQHLVFRHPIHIERPRYDKIFKSQMIDVLGYSPEDVPPSDPQIRFGILGQTPIKNSKDSIDFKHA